MKRHLLPAIFAAFALFGCPKQSTSVVNVAPIPTDTDLIPAMCTHLQVLGCAEGKDLYDSDLPGPHGIPNETCAQFYEKQQDNGIFINPRCVMKVSSCADIESARQKDCSKE